MTINTDESERSTPSSANSSSRVPFGGIDPNKYPPDGENGAIDAAKGIQPMEIVSDPVKNHHPYPIPDVENGNDGTVATKSIMSITGTFDYSSHHSRKVENSYPLLQGVPIDDLPPRFQRLLVFGNPSCLSNTTSPVKSPCSISSKTHPAIRNAYSIRFYPGHIPMPQCYFLFVAVPFAMCLAGMVVGFTKGTTMKGGFWASFGLVAMCVGAILWSAILAYNNHKKRAPLFARDAEGARKPWPGDWKAGTYLVGRTALVHYDGIKAWLFPVQDIVHVEHTRPQTRNSKYHTVVVFRTPIPNTFDETNKEIARYELDHLEEPCKGWDIHRWFERCTEPLGRSIP